MKARVLYLAKYFLFWINFFIVTKGIFLIYHSASTAALDISTITDIFTSGLKLDISFAAYLTLLPGLLMAFSAFLPAKATRLLSHLYTGIALVCASLLIVVDLELYRTWNFRIDATPFMYLNTPREMLASAGASPLLLLSLLFIGMLSVSAAVYYAMVAPAVAQLRKISAVVYYNAAAFLVFLCLTALLIIPVRGGLQQIPINQSMVYFSSSDFANHAAVNPMWNFFNSWVSKTYEKENPYNYYPAEEAAQKIHALYVQNTRKEAEQVQRLINTEKPNVLVIIWESLTAKVIEPLGGLPGITPEFTRLHKEGILFKNLYASGNRSDKGIVAILSAFPAQPKTSIITIPHKTAHLPYLSTDFQKAGYQTAFYYGGELEFANIKSYLLKGGYQKITGKDAFNPEDMNSKWGAHDHVVYNRLLHDIHTAPAEKPFFYTLFTLSSHEPFEVPVEAVIKGTDEQSKFLNAMHYADRSLGAFIEKAKKQPWWQNTLVVIVADHGHRLPAIHTEDLSKEFHIPMLWLGGALAEKNKVVDRLSSQIDIAPTLLSQLNLPYSQYRWGKDIFSPASRPFAYFVYNDGFGLLQPGKQLIFDNVGKRVVSGNCGEEDLAIGKSYLQMAYQDYLDK
jgi:phosphoglycerol transferase MdoB-like AlkP superfamily enzyme